MLRFATLFNQIYMLLWETIKYTKNKTKITPSMSSLEKVS